jgi:hypothetical protein
MRTTIRLDDGLLEQAREEARRRGETLTALIEQGLRHELAKTKTAGPRRKVEIPVSKQEGWLRPGLDLTSTSRPLGMLEEGLPIEKLR